MNEYMVITIFSLHRFVYAELKGLVMIISSNIFSEHLGLNWVWFLVFFFFRVHFFFFSFIGRI